MNPLFERNLENADLTGSSQSLTDVVLKQANARVESVFLPEMIDSIDWALDVSKAERELSKFSPIERQYEIMSGTPFYRPKSAEESETK